MSAPQDCSTPLGERFDRSLEEKLREIARLQKILENQQPGPFLTERELVANIEHREGIIRDLKKTLAQKYAEISKKDAKIAKLKNSKRKLKRQLKKAKKQAIPARPHVR
jgi:septal ring factor EnvC (AmiA/AmiB activator)